MTKNVKKGPYAEIYVKKVITIKVFEILRSEKPRKFAETKLSSTGGESRGPTRAYQR